MTTAEIVQALRYCATIDGRGCHECPAKDIELKPELDCYELMKIEAADLIERLEKEKAVLMESVRGGCISCKHWARDAIDCRVVGGCTSCRKDCKCKGCGLGKNWEWKGLEDEK